MTAGAQPWLCAECHPGHELVNDGRRCLRCGRFENNCEECSVNAITNSYTACTSCFTPYELLNDGTCGLPNCFQSAFGFFQKEPDLDYDYVIYCDTCYDGYGTSEPAIYYDSNGDYAGFFGGGCHECTSIGHEEDWEDCMSCEVWPSFGPFTCTECANGKVLIDNPHFFIQEDFSAPEQICGYKEIDHCEIQNKTTGECELCECGYFYDGFCCSPCNIGNCNTCVTMSDGYDIWPSCTACDDDYALIIQQFRNDYYKPQGKCIQKEHEMDHHH